jgi:hypothetical protein
VKVVSKAQLEGMQDQLAWALGCALLWALGSSLWIIGLALLALYAILHALEKSRRFHPVTIPSSLWSDLDKLTLEDLDQAVRYSSCYLTLWCYRPLRGSLRYVFVQLVLLPSV